ncbi:MAG: glycosyltransferase [Paracoccaceae bacterium]
MPYLSDVQSALVLVLLVWALTFVVKNHAIATNNLHRGLIFAVSAALGLRYILWRATETVAPLGFTVDAVASWSFLAIEALAMAGSFSSFLMMSRTKDRAEEVETHWRWWEQPDYGPPHQPTVAILIATYNEDLDVLERTIVGAQSLRYPHKTVYILDDGKRDWLRDYCAVHHVEYVTRPDNKGAKAGNINHTVQLLARAENPPDYLAVLDADFVPHKGFLQRSLALFHDPQVGLVQTPQHFFNADPIQHNLGLSRSYPDEQRFFFDHVQPSRDAWGIAFCCGTSSVMRFKAVAEIGGFPTESVTEDFMLTLVLQEHGWKTVYLNEALTEGLAPEGLKEYITQRARWCLGLMQIARSDYGPFGKSKLRLRDRWSVADSVVFWLSTFSFRLAAIFFPLLYWFFNVIVVDAQLAEVLRFFAPYYLWSLMAISFVSRGGIIPVLNDVTQLVGAIPITAAAVMGLLKPHGHAFKVTAKGGDRGKIVVQWTLMRPFLIGLVLTLVGLMIGIFSDRFAFYDAGQGKIVILFWTIYNLLVLAMTVLACIELPRRERHIADAPERAKFTSVGWSGSVWLVGLARDTARIRGVELGEGTTGKIDIRGVGRVPALVLGSSAAGVRLSLMPDDPQLRALTMRFYTEGDAPGVTHVRASALFRDIARRLSFNSGRR